MVKRFKWDLVNRWLGENSVGRKLSKKLLNVDSAKSH